MRTHRPRVCDAIGHRRDKARGTHISTYKSLLTTPADTIVINAKKIHDDDNTKKTLCTKRLSLISIIFD